jgi:hypothetical protein
MGAVLVLVQRSQSQGADVACNVVARGDRVVDDGIGADEADLDVGIVSIYLLRLGARLEGWWPPSLGGGHCVGGSGCLIRGLGGGAVGSSSPSAPS